MKRILLKQRICLKIIVFVIYEILSMEMKDKRKKNFFLSFSKNFLIQISFFLCVRSLWIQFFLSSIKQNEWIEFGYFFFFLLLLLHFKFFSFSSEKKTLSVTKKNEERMKDANFFFTSIPHIFTIDLYSFHFFHSYKPLCQ